MTTILIVLLIVLFLALAVMFIYNKVKNTPEAVNHDKILILNNADFNNAIKNKTILVDFWADWCMPCKMMAPILNELADELPEGKYVGKVDVEKNPQLSQKFGVRGIPTLILFKNGKEIDRFVGVKSKSALKSSMMKV